MILMSTNPEIETLLQLLSRLKNPEMVALKKTGRQLVTS
mgnify:CR=1 FL=1